MHLNPEKERIADIIHRLLRRNRLSVEAVTGRMARYGVDLSEDKFENRFTLRLNRRPRIAPEELLALLKALTEGLPAAERCSADEAVELVLLAGLPSLLPRLQVLFPSAELATALECRPLPAYPPIQSSAPLLQLPPLPCPLTSLIGRTTELAAINLLISSNRLVTLTGPGGCGKTRLALQVAADATGAFSDGVLFLTLVDLADPDQLLATLAHALGIALVQGQSWHTTLVDALQQRRLLLVLDNFEHLLAAAPALSSLLLGCPALHLLVTSRAILRLSGEQQFIVPPLARPDLAALPTPAELMACPAVALFCERARAVNFDFRLDESNAADIAAICVALEGMPLALELAAARVRQFTPLQLRSYLCAPPGRLVLGMLCDGARDFHPRHATLYATLDWSHRLLDQATRTLLARMAIFSGGCDAEALVAVCAERSSTQPQVYLDRLMTLLDHHLVFSAMGTGSEARYTMLVAVREYALERLIERGELEAMQQRHAGYYLHLAEELVPHLHSSAQARSLNILEMELANLRAALEWFLGQGDAETALRLCAALELFWYWGGYFEEGGNWIRRALVLRDQLSPLMLARGLDELAGLEWARGLPQAAERLALESLAIWRRLANEQGIAETLNTLGLTAEAQGDFARSIAWHEESLALRRRLANLPAIVVALRNLGDAEFAAGPHLYDQALARFQECLAINRQLGDQLGIGTTLSSMGTITLLKGDLASAATYLRDSLRAFQKLGNKLRMTYAFDHLADIALAQGQAQRAARLCAAAATLRQAIGMQLPPMAVDAAAHRNEALARLLDQGTLAAAWASGAAMALERAIAYALELL